MKIEKVSQIFKEHEAELEQYSVKSLTVFGSVARGEAGEDSDIDVLVEFRQTVGLFEFIRLKAYLEEITHNRIDLVTPDALHPAMRDEILSEAIYVR